MYLFPSAKPNFFSASGKVLRAQVRDAGFDVAIKICKNMNPVRFLISKHY